MDAGFVNLNEGEKLALNRYVAQNDLLAEGLMGDQGPLFLEASQLC